MSKQNNTMFHRDATLLPGRQSADEERRCIGETEIADLRRKQVL